MPSGPLGFRQYETHVDSKRDVPDYGDVFTLAEFSDMVKCGAFNQYDGHGYFSDGKVMYESTDCFESIPEELQDNVTHVIWFNK